MASDKISCHTEFQITLGRNYFGRLSSLAVACWITGQYHPCSNLGVGKSEGCFVFDFASLPLEVARPVWPTLCKKWP